MTLKNEIQQFAERLARLEQKVDDIVSNHLSHIHTELQEVKRKINGRPSWAVAVIITVLSSLVVALTVAMLKGG